MTPEQEMRRALSALVEAEEQIALTSYWPYADHPGLSPQRGAILDREWERMDPDGFGRIKRARTALKRRAVAALERKR